MSSTALRIPVEPARRWGDTAAGLALTLSLLLLASLGLLLASGHRVLVVRSGSMAPALDPGDVVVTTRVHPPEVSLGDVVTFRDPTRSGELVTHRVLTAQPRRGGFLFLTRGDANTGTERWRVRTDESIARLWFRIPDAGHGLAFLGEPRVRVGLLALGALLLAFSQIRRGRPGRP